MRSSVKIAVASAMLPFVLAGFALAGDGRVEINHEKILAGGLSPGDAPGYPGTLGQDGSYLVTGPLFPPAGTDGIVIVADHVDLDMGGQTLLMAGDTETGIVADNVLFGSIAIRNGTIRGGGTSVDIRSFRSSARAVDVKMFGFANIGFDFQTGGRLVDCIIESSSTGTFGVSGLDGLRMTGTIVDLSGTGGTAGILLVGGPASVTDSVISVPNGAALADLGGEAGSYSANLIEGTIHSDWTETGCNSVNGSAVCPP